jgi:hypothetical protein
VHTAAVIAWLVTMSGGALLAALYVRAGGHRDSIDAERERHGGRLPGGATERDAPAITGGTVGTHALLAVIGLVVLVLWVLNEDQDGWAHGGWGALSIALVGAGIGLAMFASWLRPENRTARGVRALPAPVVYLHGLAAAATIVLVVAAIIAG